MVTFTWTGKHGVDKILNGTCPQFSKEKNNGTDIVPLAPVSKGGEYIWKASQAGTVSSMHTKHHFLAL